MTAIHSQSGIGGKGLFAEWQNVLDYEQLRKGYGFFNCAHIARLSTVVYLFAPFLLAHMLIPAFNNIGGFGPQHFA